MRGVRPLSALLYLRRNPRRVLPVCLVMGLVTALMVAVITPTNVFRTTSESYIRPLRSFTIVRPRIRSDFDERLTSHIDGNPAAESVHVAKMLWIETPMIVGDAAAPLLALAPGGQAELLRRVDLRLVEGRLPAPGTNEAALHRAVMKARRLSIGDAFGQLADPEDSTPGRFDVVGVLEGASRLGLIDLDHASVPHFILARSNPFRLVYAKEGRKAESDAWLRGLVDDAGQEELLVVDEAFVRARVEKSMENLPLLLGFISAAVAVIVALVTALLHLIHFQARADEFALWLAVGHRRGRLVRKLAVETILGATLGWVVGLLLGVGVVWLYTRLVFEPRGILVEVLDPDPLLYSLVVPVLSAVASAAGLAWRLGRMDPVAVIQRRGEG
jgi:hypothetical protein